MKKTLEAILALCCILSLVLAGAEEVDGSCNLLWTLGFLALAAIFGCALHRIVKPLNR